jgi:hypothetical protein
MKFSVNATKRALINFLIDLADAAPHINFGKVRRFECYNTDCFLVEFASGFFAVLAPNGDMYLERSYESARQHVPSMTIPIHYPGDIPDD